MSGFFYEKYSGAVKVNILHFSKVLCISLSNLQMMQERDSINLKPQPFERSLSASGPVKFLRQISENFSRSLFNNDENDSEGGPNQTPYYITVEDNSNEINTKSRGVGVFVNSKGAPTSNESRLVLHIGTLTLEGLNRVPLSRRDLKVLKRLNAEVGEIVMNAFQRISIFDYELSHNNFTLKSSKAKMKRKSQSSRLLKKLVRLLSFSSEKDILKETNKKLEPFNVEVILVKRVEKLVGTTAAVYYMLLRHKVVGEDLPS